MANPYKIYDRNQGPGWLKQLDKYIGVNNANLEARSRDTDATIRNYDGDEKEVKTATYVMSDKNNHNERSVISRERKAGK